MNQENLKNHYDTVRQAIELLQQANEILDMLIETKIPELIEKTSHPQNRKAG